MLSHLSLERECDNPQKGLPVIRLVSQKQRCDSHRIVGQV